MKTYKARKYLKSRTSYPLSPAEKREIASQIQSQADLLKYCCGEVEKRWPEADSETKRTFSLSLFIAATKKLD